MTSSRPLSPRVPPPVHPSIRGRPNDPPSSQLLGSAPNLSPQPSSSRLPLLPQGESAPDARSTSSTSQVDSPKIDPRPLPTSNEEEFTEDQLRQSYEEEEVDRFLRLFSDYIREVKVHQTQPLGSNGGALPGAPASHLDTESDEEGPTWISPHEGVTVDPQVSPPLYAGSLSEWVACHIMPYLPPAAPPPAPLTVRSVRLLVHRALVIVFHTYIPLISRAIHLASWKDPKHSMKYCLLYWFLWYHDLLLSGLIVRIAYSLIRRKYLPYPTLDELRQRRKEQERADNLTKQLITRLATSPAEHVRDLWGTFKEYRSKKKESPGHRSPSPGPGSTLPDIVIEESSPIDALVGDETLESDEHIYGPIFELATKLADIHERIRNLFLWRRPQVSTIFAFVLFGMFLLSLLPSKYILKLATLSLGIVFWHVIPVLVVLPRRMPTPLGFVPTDAEYAMDLISQRVALGLPVQPIHKSKKAGHRSPSNNSSQAQTNSKNKSAVEISEGSGSESDVDWEKWKGRLDDAKAWSGDVVESFKDGTWKDPYSWRRKSPVAQRQKVHTHTYPAQCKVPGLITLTDDQLLFTPITSLSPTLVINLKQITGVKRSGLAKGLKVRWTDVQEDGKTAEREERFLWVAERDELFARLVGSQSRKWLHS